jgi:quercetin dioxygenase-like cupin family protein
MTGLKIGLVVLLACVAGTAVSAEEPKQDRSATAQHLAHDVSCIPIAQQATRKLGCFVTGTQVVGKLPNAPVYWHLVQYPTLAAAEGAAKEAHGSVVESYGKVWLFNIAGASWNPTGGQRIARVGPLPVNTSASYTAQYMLATFEPGMRSAVHRHPGPEAWYVLAGEQCLETPGRKQIVRAGESGIVEEGPPMMLVGTGTTERRSLVVILHDSSKPAVIPAPDWKPAGLCAG